MHGLGRGEDIGVEGEDHQLMVDADGEVTLLAAVHDELLDRGGGDLERVGELCKLETSSSLTSV